MKKGSISQLMYLGSQIMGFSLLGVPLVLFIQPPELTALCCPKSISLLFIENSFEEILRDSGDVVGYMLVFVFAAIPALELWTVIPLGIAIGMNPLGVAFFGFLGSLLSVYAIIIFFAWIKRWIEARGDKTNEETSSSKKRAKRIFEKFGAPGLAIGSPFVVGIHLGTVLVLVMGAKKRDAVIWMTVSIMFWTLVLTATSYYGIESIRSFL